MDRTCNLFIVASLTDMLDGKIARKYNLVTNFGKFMDPLADKLLVCSAMICLIPLGKLPTAVVIVIIAREFIISGFRLVASDNGVVIAANYWGKFKTVSQMAMIIVLIADFGGVFDMVGTVLIWIATALTVISPVDYVWQTERFLQREACKRCIWSGFLKRKLQVRKSPGRSCSRSSCRA